MTCRIEVAAVTRTFSTATVEDSSQLEYWREVICASFIRFQLEPQQRRRGIGFRGEVTAHRLGGVEVLTVVSEPHAVSRSPQLIRESSEDDFLVNLAVRGRVAVTQDGRDAELEPGDFTVYDSTRPCRIACPDPFELLVLKVPRRLLAAHYPLPPHATATAVRGDRGAGALFSPFARSLAAHLPDMSPETASRVGATVLDLLAAALLDRIGADAPPGMPRAAQLARARRYIADHLSDPELSPATVAQALGMSVRYLHALFSAENSSPFRWIQEQRLDKAARLLADPRQTARTVTDIAFGVGFKDASHFTRTFKNRYGDSPRDYRRGRGAPERITPEAPTAAR